MDVELFTVEEVEPGDVAVSPEVAAEAAALVERLGLTGQEKFTQQADDGTIQRVPFPALTQPMERAVTALAPSVYDLKAYTRDAIPLRILKAVDAHADLFNHWLVYSDDHDADPFLIGIIGERYGGQKYLVGRWGEHLFPFEQLATRAHDRLVRMWKARAARAKAALAAFEPESAVVAHLAGEYVPLPF